MAWSEREPGRERMGCWGRVRGEDSCHPGGHLSAGAAGGWYCVWKSWADAGSQKGAFQELGNAKECTDGNPGYKVFDWNGNAVYGKADGDGVADAVCLFMVRVGVADLNIREGAGTDTPRMGKYTGKGCFTIV